MAAQPTLIRRQSVETTSRWISETSTFDSATGTTLSSTIDGAIDTNGTSEYHTTTTTLYATEGAAFAPGGAFQSTWLALPQPSGQEKSVDGPRTDVTDTTTYVYYPYDATVPGAWRGKLAAVRNAAGHITWYEDYDAFGHALTLVDPNGIVTRSTYDALGRLLTTTIVGVPGCDTGADPLCSTDLTTTRSYTATTGPLATERQPNGSMTSYTYDARGRILTITRGTETADNERTTYTYDAATGHKASETLSAYENGTWVTKKTESYTYNADGTLKLLVHADNTTIQYAYLPDGKLSSIQDENHTTPNTTYTYDPVGRISVVTQTLASAPNGRAATQYGYDVASNVTSVTDPNGNLTTYQYDDFARLQRQVSPVSGTTAYTYDLAGNVRTTTDANGATITRTYDALNRITTANATKGSATETVTWTYDSGPFGIGRMASMTDLTGTTGYTYERRGVLQAEAKNINGVSYTTAYQYDANRNRNKITYPSGLVAQYTYDWANRPYALSANSTPVVTAATYAPFGPLTSITFGNGTTRAVSYDTRYRVSRNTLAGPSGTIADYTYLEDSVGNITQIHDALEAAYNRDFAYDDLNRLTTANTGASLWGPGSYTYDAMGNALTATLGTWTTMSATLVGTTPKLSSVTENGITRSLTYDPAANETTLGTATFSYSPNNQLVTTDFSANAYDGRGILTIVTTSSVAVSVPESLGGSGTGTGTVTLNTTAVADTPVALSSNNNAAAVPASATVLAGRNSADFTISASPVATDTIVTITATQNGESAVDTVTVMAARVTALALDPASAHAGDTVTATATLDSAAAAGMSVTITGAIVGSPVSAPVATGATTATTTITPLRLTNGTQETRTIAGTLNGATAQATLTVTPPVLTGFTVAPSAVVGGDPSTAQATVTGTPEFEPQQGMNVRVTSTNPATAGAYGASLSIPGSSTSGSGSVLTAPVATLSTVVITGTTDTVNRSASLSVQPVNVTIASLTVSPTSVVGSNLITGTITLTAAAPTGGIDVDLSTNNTAATPRPAYVHITPGNTSASFSVDTKVVTTSTTITLSAVHAVTTKAATFTLTAPRSTYLSGLTPQTGTALPNGIGVAGGTLVTSTARISAAATGKTTITLSSSNTAVATVPSSVNVSNGATSANFTITTVNVTNPASTTITASYGGVMQTLIVTALPANGVTIASIGGLMQSAQRPISALATITLTGPAPTGGATITLGGARQNIIDIPANMTVPAGATYATFAYSVYPFLGYTRTTDVTATYMGITQASRYVLDAVTLTADKGRPVQCAALAIEPCIIGTVRIASVPAGNPARYYLYTSELQLLTETEQTSSSTKPLAYSYLWFGGQPVAQIDSTNAIRWYATDHLGTPFLQTDATGAVVWRTEAAPYGEIFTYRGGAASHQPLRMPGQVAIDTNESVYNVFRWYRAAWGRYTQPDPLGLGPDQNVYRYPLNAPIAKDDALGLDTAGCDTFDREKWTPCHLECCAQHDKCYDDWSCTARSWPFKKHKGPCDRTPECIECNNRVQTCWLMCKDPKTDDPKKPNYYCGKLHRYINIPGSEFPNIDAAVRTCECDYTTYNCAESASKPTKPAKPSKP